jgi:hypothetical protein
MKLQSFIVVIFIQIYASSLVRIVLCEICFVTIFFSYEGSLYCFSWYAYYISLINEPLLVLYAAFIGFVVEVNVKHAILSLDLVNLITWPCRWVMNTIPDEEGWGKNMLKEW